MIGLIILLVLFSLMFYIIKTYIEIHSNILMLKKNSKVIEQKNDLEQHYQAIKGLY